MDSCASTLPVALFSAPQSLDLPKCLTEHACTGRARQKHSPWQMLTPTCQPQLLPQDGWPHSLPPSCWGLIDQMPLVHFTWVGVRHSNTSTPNLSMFYLLKVPVHIFQRASFHLLQRKQALHCVIRYKASLAPHISSALLCASLHSLVY